MYTHASSRSQLAARRTGAKTHSLRAPRHIPAPPACAPAGSPVDPSPQPDPQPEARSAAEQQQAHLSTGNAMHYSLSESEETWRRLDKRVNTYPIQRAFTAIGRGGSEFKASMIKAVEDVVGPVHVECISDRPSSQGSYISVTVGPVWVESCEQIIAIYAKMKELGSTNIKWII